MKTVVVDLGNYNVKYLADRKGIFSAKYSTKFNANSEMFERIEIDGQLTMIGVGEYEREFNKVDKNYIPLLLYAIDKATNESDINLCLLLPVSQISNKDKMINSLKGNTFTFDINGKNRRININKVAVLAEGFVSYYSLDEDIKDDILIIDVGSRTINYSSFLDGKLEKSFTEKLGVFDLYSTIKDIQNSQGGDYVEEDIERLIKNNKIVVDSKIYLEFLKDILNRTKSKVNIKSYNKVIFVGGGSSTLKDYIEANTPAIVLDDAIYANVTGAHKLCEVVWGGNK